MSKRVALVNVKIVKGKKVYVNDRTGEEVKEEDVATYTAGAPTSKERMKELEQQFLLEKGISE